MCRRPVTYCSVLPLFVLAAVLTVGVHGQTPPTGGGAFDPSQSFDPLQQFGTPPGLSFDARVEFEGSFRVKQSTGEGQLQVRATIEPNWHMYSLTQAPGGPNRTELTVPPSPDFELTAPFSADRDPFKHADEVFPGIEVEEFADEVVFSAPFKLKEGVAPDTLKIAVTVDGQVCETGGACELIESELVEASFAGFIEEQTPTGTYYEDGSAIRISGYFDPQTVTPGSVVKLELTADLEPKWHVYAYDAEKVEGTVACPTLIVIRKSAGFEIGTPRASAPPTETDSGLEEEPILRYHKDSVTWSVPITIPKSTEPGEYEIAGSMAYQTCTDAACDDPKALQFAATIKVGATAAAGQVPLVFQPSSYTEVAQLAATQAKQQTEATAAAPANGASTPLPRYWDSPSWPA